MSNRGDWHGLVCCAIHGCDLDGIDCPVEKGLKQGSPCDLCVSVRDDLKMMYYQINEMSEYKAFFAKEMGMLRTAVDRWFEK